MVGAQALGRLLSMYEYLVREKRRNDGVYAFSFFVGSGKIGIGFSFDNGLYPLWGDDNDECTGQRKQISVRLLSC